MKRVTLTVTSLTYAHQDVLVYTVTRQSGVKLKYLTKTVTSLTYN